MYLCLCVCVCVDCEFWFSEDCIAIFFSSEKQKKIGFIIRIHTKKNSNKLLESDNNNTFARLYIDKYVMTAKNCKRVVELCVVSLGFD